MQINKQKTINICIISWGTQTRSLIQKPFSKIWCEDGPELPLELKITQNTLKLLIDSSSDLIKTEWQIVKSDLESVISILKSKWEIEEIELGLMNPNNKGSNDIQKTINKWCKTEKM